MEEEEKDIIYDLDTESGAGSAEIAQSEEQRGECGELLQVAAIDEDSDHSDISDHSDNSDNSDNPDTRLRQMIEVMGAETLLEIIRDNRNAAIRQIISEMEASQDRALQSGASAAVACNSIFDLAALA